MVALSDRPSTSNLVASRHTISGTLTLASERGQDNFKFVLGPPGCHGGSPYPDIAAGTGVVLKDGDGKTIAVGSLGPGVGDGAGNTYRCIFSFSLADVPEVPFYSVEVSRRGAVTSSLAAMKAANWTVSLTLGK